MLQQPNSSLLTISPPDSNFTPRREFWKDNHHHIPSSYALLTLASNNLLRFASFPSEVILALRRHFEQLSLLRAFKEDTSANLYEFSLHHKPWTTSKTISSEKLFIAVLNIIYRHGFNLLSTIDYGREHDDRISIAFSKIASQTSSSPDKVPFALSFPSATVLRVIDPPLHSTPAILQAVRSAWPRGIVTEKKVAGHCYQFKLKGYRWFQEDTFPMDSLRLVLSLLQALDSHTFTLITSLSISGNHSRVKDFWIFTGLAQCHSNDSDSSSPSPTQSNADVALNNSNSNLLLGSSSKRVEGPYHTGSVNALDMTTGTSNVSSAKPQLTTTIIRLDQQTKPSLILNSMTAARSTLRKKAFSTNPTLPRTSEEDLPLSTPTNSSSSVLDMTGVGAAMAHGMASRNVGRTGRDANTEYSMELLPPPVEILSNATENMSSTTSQNISKATTSRGELHIVPGILYATPDFRLEVDHDTRDKIDADRTCQTFKSETPQAKVNDRLTNDLSPSAARPGKTSQGYSFDVPIHWTGNPDIQKSGYISDRILPEDAIDEQSNSAFSSRNSEQRISSSDERSSAGQNSFNDTSVVLPPQHSVVQEGKADSSPEAQVLSTTLHESSQRSKSDHNSSDDRNTSSTSGQRSGFHHLSRSTSPAGSGWVLISVEGIDETLNPKTSEGIDIQSISASNLRSASIELQKGKFPYSVSRPEQSSKGELRAESPNEQVSSMSPIAKVLVAADAISPPNSDDDVKNNSKTSALQRIFKSKGKSTKGSKKQRL